MDPELPELPSAANASRCCCNRTSLRIVFTSKRVSNSKNPVRRAGQPRSRRSVYLHTAGNMSTVAWLATSFLMLARGDQQAESLDSLAAPLRPTRRRMYKAWFLYGRSNFPGLGARGVTEQVKYEMTMRGQATWEVGGKRIAEPKERRPEPVNVGQVASPRILELLLHRDGRPVWTAALWKEHASRLAAGHSLSPPHYPHSSEDLALAWDAFARPFKAARWAVWSSISPWVESKLFGWGATKVTTVDYNPPHVDDGPEVAFTGAMLQILDQATLADAYAANAAAASSTAQSLASGLFDVVVSFSGVEHDGLGRYGDPVNPEGDLAALREIWLSLRAGGLLFVAVPVAAVDAVHRLQHRVYGPKRLRRLVRGFEVLGWVWDGRIIAGDTLAGPDLYTTPRQPPHFRRNMKTEHHQPVLCLRRPNQQPRASTRHAQA